MIDAFAIFLTHALLAVAWWRLRGRDDLDDEAPAQTRDRGAGFGTRGGTG